MAVCSVVKVDFVLFFIFGVSLVGLDVYSPKDQLRPRTGGHPAETICKLYELYRRLMFVDLEQLGLQVDVPETSQTRVTLYFRPGKLSRLHLRDCMELLR